MLRTNRLLTLLAPAAALALGVQAVAVAQEASTEEPASIVVTTAVLGSVVDAVVGDAADVTVLMPSGADPHEWQPSARDVERVMEAALVVENGLDLEEALIGVLEQARADGVDIFTAADHVEVRLSEESHDDRDAHADAEGHDHAEGAEQAEGEEHADEHMHEDEDADHEDAHGHGPEDPHLWLDPVAMGSVVDAMVPAMAELGIDVEDGAAAFEAELDALDAEIEAMIATIPEDQRKLVTGHEALGYFVDRYGLEQIGAVLPSLSTSGEPAARDIAELIETMEAAGVSIVFTDIGAPAPLVQAVAEATGADVVPVNDAQLPDDGSYVSLMRERAQAITRALAG